MLIIEIIKLLVKMSFNTTVILVLILTVNSFAKGYQLFESPKVLPIKDLMTLRRYSNIVLSPQGNRYILIYETSTSIVLYLATIKSEVEVTYYHARSINNTGELKEAFWLPTQILILIFENGICYESISNLSYGSIDEDMIYPTQCLKNMYLQNYITASTIEQEQNQIYLYALVSNDSFVKYRIDEKNQIQKIAGFLISESIFAANINYTFFKHGQYECFIAEQYQQNIKGLFCYNFQTFTQFSHEIEGRYDKLVTLDNGETIFFYHSPFQIYKVTKLVDSLSLQKIQANFLKQDQSCLNFNAFGNNLLLIKSIKNENVAINLFNKIGQSYREYESIPFRQCKSLQFLQSKSSKIMFTCAQPIQNVLITLNQVPQIQLNYIVPLALVAVIFAITRFSILKVIRKTKEYPVTLDWKTIIGQTLITVVLYVVILCIFAFTNIHQEVLVENPHQITTIGSYSSRILYYIFLSSAVIFLLCELHLETMLKNKNINMLRKHGLTFSFHISMRVFLIIFKSLNYGISAIAFIYTIQQIFLLQQQRVFTSFIEIVNICCAYSICLSNLTILSISINLFVESFWYTAEINLVACYFTVIFTEHLATYENVTVMEVLFVVLNPIANFYTILESIIQTQFRYATIAKYVDLSYVFVTLIIHMIAASFFHTLYTIYKYKRFDLSQVIKVRKPKESILESQSSINHELECESQFQEEKQSDIILSVFIPCKFNIYNKQGKKKVLENIRFSGKRNQIITFIDYQNISKSHLFKILINEEKSDSLIERNQQGEVRYYQNIKLSYCLDKNFYYEQLNALQHLELFLRLKSGSLQKEQLKKKVQVMLNEFNIPLEEGMKKSKYLSGGYLKKMCLACAFIGDPDVIIIDEPTLGLDIRFKKIFWEKLKKWKQNRLIIVGTSDSEEAETISDKIWILDRSKMIDYAAYKRKKLMIILSLSFFTYEEFEKAKELISHITKSWGIIPQQQNKGNQFILTLSIYSIQQTIYPNLNKLMSSLENLLSNRYYFSFRIIENKFHSHEYSKYYNNKCNYCNRQELLQMIHKQLNDVYELNEMLYQQRNQNIFKKKAQDFLLLLVKQEKKHNSIYISQFKAILYQRFIVIKNKKLIKKQLFFTTIYFWITTLYYFINHEESVYLRWIAFTKLVAIYGFLHIKMISSHLENEDIKKYLLTIGLNIRFYWIGNWFINFCYLFLPIFMNIMVWFAVQYTIFLKVQLNLTLCLFGTLLYTLNFITTILIASNLTSRISILLTMLSLFNVFPLLINKDIYLLRYTEHNTQTFSLMKYLYYPISFTHLISQEFSTPQWQYILVMIYEYIINVLVFVIVRNISLNKKKKERLKSKDLMNVSNQSIREEQSFIDAIEDKSKFVYGQNITKKINKHFAVQNIYFHIKEGEVFGFLGHNGSGKTTLFKIITNKIQSTIGEVNFFGQVNEKMGFEHRLKVGYCPQFYSLYGQMTVQQNIKFIGMLKGLEETYIARYIILFIQYFRMKGNQKTYIKYLTEGQRRKFSLIVAFLGFPKLLLFDETTTGIDTESRIKSINLIKTYCKLFNSAALITSHNISEAQQFCDRVCILKSGKMVRSGSPFELKKLASQEMYRLIINIKSEQSPVIVQRKIEMLRNYVKSLRYFNVSFQEGYKLIYSLDMVQVNILAVLNTLLEFFKNGIIEKFSLYKHDLEEVVKYAMNDESKLIQIQNSQFGDSRSEFND